MQRNPSNSAPTRRQPSTRASPDKGPTTGRGPNCTTSTERADSKPTRAVTGTSPVAESIVVDLNAMPPERCKLGDHQLDGRTETVDSVLLPWTTDRCDDGRTIRRNTAHLTERAVDPAASLHELLELRLVPGLAAGQQESNATHRVEIAQQLLPCGRLDHRAEMEPVPLVVRPFLDLPERAVELPPRPQPPTPTGRDRKTSPGIRRPGHSSVSVPSSRYRERWCECSSSAIPAHPSKSGPPYRGRAGRRPVRQSWLAQWCASPPTEEIGVAVITRGWPSRRPRQVLEDAMSGRAPADHAPPSARSRPPRYSTRVRSATAGHSASGRLSGPADPVTAPIPCRLIHRWS